MKHRSLAILLAAAGLFLARPASAQRTGFAVDRFEPAERGSRFFVVDSLDIRGDQTLAVGGTLDYGHNALVVYNPDGSERAPIVRHQLFAHIGGSIVLLERLRLGLNVPVALYQDGDATIVDTGNGPEAFKPANKAALGDVRLAADLRLLGEAGSPLVLAAGLRAWLPTGQRSQFTSDGSARIAPQVLASGDIGMFTYGARLAIVYRARDDVYAGSSLGSELAGSAAAGIKALDDKLVVGPEVFATSVFTSGDAFFKTRGTPAEWLLGAHYDVGPMRLGVGGGSGLTRGYGAPDVRGLLSVEYVTPPTRDRDHDGILDAEDACPDVPGVRSVDPALNGCPLAPAKPVDTDGDGILDSEDACPTIPGPKSNDPATNGCPDRDGDGIVDRLDACPDVPGVASEDPKKNGCPPDRDGDGIPDGVDACPDVPGVADPDPKKNGCPGDSDGDGIVDTEDACPKVAGPRNPDPKKNGCPLVVVTEKAIQINEQVKFKFDSAELLPESDVILGEVKKVLDEHKDLTLVRVEGHTDNVGKADYNRKLSQRRAESVMKWLVKHGVDTKRLKAQGFGPDEPIDTNDTDAGRANNRRVAFTILKREDAAPAPKP